MEKNNPHFDNIHEQIKSTQIGLDKHTENFSTPICYGIEGDETPRLLHILEQDLGHPSTPTICKDIYFDTPNFDLAKQGGEFRLRGIYNTGNLMLPEAYLIISSLPAEIQETNKWCSYCSNGLTFKDLTTDDFEELTRIIKEQNLLPQFTILKRRWKFGTNKPDEPLSGLAVDEILGIFNSYNENVDGISNHLRIEVEGSGENEIVKKLTTSGAKLIPIKQKKYSALIESQINNE
ncbi:CYTH domain-containing protein [Candidatus Dojkabacteria bacterium]|nr:CYTH domain-containing protein [Candidatus Dojkabacteria bacterium]